MKIGIFGGSFDPVHNEHIALAKAAIKDLNLDCLFVMPAHTPPHKKGKVLSSDAERLQMCSLAFQGVEKVQISDYEISQGGTSYTYLTCRHFKEKYADAELFFLVGTDMLRDFPTWRNPDDILQTATLAVCGRAENADWAQKAQADFYQRFKKNFALISYNGAAISSTKLRVLAGAGMGLNDYTPAEVAKYVKERKLYEIPFAFEALNLETQKRRAHSIRVADLAAKKALQMGLSERKAITAALFHDCAKNLEPGSKYLEGFSLRAEWGDVPEPVVHQYAGAYVAEKFFGVEDEDVLNAIRFHTSGRENMSELEKLIFLADMLEEERSYDCVEDLRRLFWSERGVDACLEEALYQTLEFLKRKNQEIYFLTERAYAYALRERHGR